MPLPDNPNDAWPPAEFKPVAADIDTAAAWYEGDEAALARTYGQGTSGSGRPSDGGVAAAVSRWFWGKRLNDLNSERQRLHIPAAADIASTGADLLFGESPTFLVPEAHAEVIVEPTVDGEPAPPTEATAAVQDALATEERLAAIVEEDGIDAKLLEAAELCGGLGGVYLRPRWEVRPDGTPDGDHPSLSVMQADQAVPEWRHGELVAVTFWSVVKVDAKGAIWRHLERHSTEGIEHALYVGTQTAIGDRVDLDRDPSTRDLAVDDAGFVTTIPESLRGRMLCRYVPNVRPNRRHRKTPHGRPDTQGTEGLMDALDEAWSSWMRDLRLGKARLIVPDSFLHRAGRGEGARFDADTEVFAPLNIDPANADKAGITPVEFKIRTDEHHATCMALFTQIVQTAGYSPQSFGVSAEGGMQTATEVDAREGRSLRTTERKARYWRRALVDVLEVLLILDAEVYGSDVTPYRPQVVFADFEGSNVRDMASTLNLIGLARAASIETRVRMLHPDWDDGQVKAEAEQIRLEEGIGQAPDPTGGLPL